MQARVRFQALLTELHRARMEDEELHRIGATLAQRVDSHERLLRLRAEVAMARTEAGFDQIKVSSVRDSRSRRGVGTV